MTKNIALKTACFSVGLSNYHNFGLLAAGQWAIIGQSLQFGFLALQTALP